MNFTLVAELNLGFWILRKLGLLIESIEESNDFFKEIINSFTELDSSI